MSVSRRQFVQMAGLALSGASLSGASFFGVMAWSSDTEQPPLPVPPLLESKRGQPLFLTLQKVHWPFVTGQKTAMWGVNGHYPGPTIKVQKNSNVKLVYGNRLAESVSMTISGLQLSGTLSGGAARMIAAGMDWSPVLPVRQNACSGWYHANTPKHMARHVYQGLVGMWLVEDEISRTLPIPSHYGVDDFPIILQDKRLDNFRMAGYQPPESGGFIGNRLLVNGVQNPFVAVSRGWVRLRLLNASSARRYTLQLSDGRPLHVIAGDQGFLPERVAVSQLMLAPGERREVVIDISDGKEVSVIACEPAGIIDRLRDSVLFRWVRPSGSLISTLALTLRPSGLLAPITDTLPLHFLAEKLPQPNPLRARIFRLGDVSAGINGMIWDRGRIDVQAEPGTWERWTIHANMPQSFHIQGVAFLVSRVNGMPARAEDSGWKDTVWVDGSVELLVYFSQTSSADFPLLYYSQTLEMADRGSVGQLAVVPVAG